VWGKRESGETVRWGGGAHNGVGGGVGRGFSRIRRSGAQYGVGGENLHLRLLIACGWNDPIKESMGPWNPVKGPYFPKPTR